MRVNLEDDEYIVASMPKVWINETGLLGYLKRSKEGILTLTNKNLIFVPKRVLVTKDEMSRFVDFQGKVVKVTRIKGYSEKNLDEDILNNQDSILILLDAIIEAKEVKIRKSSFLRVSFMGDERRVKAYDFGIAESITNYPIRQPLLFYNISWEPWTRLIYAYKV
jgi:hypothetical protein